MTIKRLKPNGTLPIPLGVIGAFKTLSIVGGPYDAYAPFAAKYCDPFGVCVRKENSESVEKDVHLPIRDFSIPDDEGQVRHALEDTLRAAIRGQQVYVGCMGGWGRTGLFMALLAKAAGVQNPVGYVRRNYTEHAVEMDEQKAYVEQFDVSGFRRFIAKEAWLGWVFNRP